MSALSLTAASDRESSRPSADAGPMSGSAFNVAPSLPLVVDLDGTLIAADMLYESFFSAVRRNPLVVLSCFKWLLRGRAALKRELAVRCRIDWDRLKWHEDVLALLLREKTASRPVVLATAADALLAAQVAARLALFDRVIASDGRRNLKGVAKAQALKQLFPAGFIYAGDSKDDLSVWHEAHAIVVVKARRSVAAAARALGRPTLELAGRVGR